jgi:S1-C subfamily serine protease
MQMQDHSGYGGYGGYGQPPSGDYGHTAPLPPMPPPPPRRRVGLLSYVAVALVAGALGAGSVVALYHPAGNSSAAPSAQPSIGAPTPLPSTAVPAPSSSGAGTAGGSLAKAGRGVVIINTTLQYSSERAAGTGMVINAKSGLVLTNNHVIENSTKITATVAATRQNFKARVVGYDVTGDIALIQLQSPSGLHQVPLGDASKVKVGDAVTALGNAEGRSQIVAAPGHITGVNRTITANDQGGTVTSETLHGMLQTDAGVVSGDSGGPLVNAAGQVIGMDTAGNDVRFPDQQSAAGFAIPVNTALSVAREIAAGHASSTISIGYPPFIGIYVGQGTSSNPQQQAEAQQQQNDNGFGGFGGGNGFGGNGSAGNGQSCYSNDSNLPVPNTIAPAGSGTLVIGTICNSPAADAGVTAGSVITSVNGQAIGAPQTLHTALSKFRPGNTVSLTWVTPSGQHKTANMTLTEGPPL